MLIRPPAEAPPQPAETHSPSTDGPRMPRAHAFFFPLRHACHSCHSCHLPAYTAQRERMTGVTEMTGFPAPENFWPRLSSSPARTCFLFLFAPSRLSFLSSSSCARSRGPERVNDRNDRSDRNDRLPAVRKFLTDAHLESRAKPVPGCRDSGVTRMTGMTGTTTPFGFPKRIVSWFEPGGWAGGKVKNLLLCIWHRFGKYFGVLLGLSTLDCCLRVCLTASPIARRVQLCRCRCHFGTSEIL